MRKFHYIYLAQNLLKTVVNVHKTNVAVDMAIGETIPCT